MSDVHLGAHREPALRKLEQDTFERAMLACVGRRVDFILISGDLFHVGIPDLGVVDSALSKMMEVKKAGIPIYAIYGSHDYTPTSTSVIDILHTAGVLTNISRWSSEDGKLELDVVTDPGTGARLAGISARKIGLERKYYEILDRDSLEELEGFKIFAFHSGITQFKPPNLSEMETVDISLFPKGFDYYAGGHIHQRGEYRLEGYERVVFPGPLFTGYGRDVEDTAKGEPRGFYLVEFDETVRGVEFVPVASFAGVYKELSVEGINSVEANERLRRLFEGAEVGGSLVAIRVFGELAGGRPSDLELAELKSKLVDRGAVHVYLNRGSVTARESSVNARGSEDPGLIESRIFEQEAGRVKVGEKSLSGKTGARTAVELLRVLRHGPKATEQKKDYERRMTKDGAAALQMEEEIQ